MREERGKQLVMAIVGDTLIEVIIGVGEEGPTTSDGHCGGHAYIGINWWGRGGANS